MGSLHPFEPRPRADGRQVTLAPSLLDGVQRQCERARAVLAGGGPVYGVNTGMGALSGVALTDGQQRAHQRNLMLARAVGGPPCTDAHRHPISRAGRDFQSGL